MESENTIPLFPLGLVLLPQMQLPLHIFEERYKLMIEECLKENSQFGIVYFNGNHIETVGCTASILKVIKRYSDGRMDILTRGENRFVVKNIFDRKPYLEADIGFFDDVVEEKKEDCRQLADQGMGLLNRYMAIAEVKIGYGSAETMDFKSISFLIAGCDGFSYPEKQRFLEMSSTHERLKKCVESLSVLSERMKITAEIRRIIGGNGNMRRLSSKSVKADSR